MRAVPQPTGLSDLSTVRYAPITLAEFAANAGCSLARAASLLADAEQRGLIESLDPIEARGRGLEVDRHPGARWYRACPEKWATAPLPNWASKMGGSGK